MNAKVNHEVMLQDHPEFEKYKGKTILLVGAGPTASEVNWEKMDLDYDYIWTCNNFHKNEKLSSLPVDMAMLI